MYAWGERAAKSHGDPSERSAQSSNPPGQRGQGRFPGRFLRPDGRRFVSPRARPRIGFHLDLVFLLVSLKKYPQKKTPLVFLDRSEMVDWSPKPARFTKRCWRFEVTEASLSLSPPRCLSTPHKFGELEDCTVRYATEARRTRAKIPGPPPPRSANSSCPARPMPHLGNLGEGFWLTRRSRASEASTPGFRVMFLVGPAVWHG